jgi:hypothetical protein
LQDAAVPCFRFGRDPVIYNQVPLTKETLRAMEVPDVLLTAGGRGPAFIIRKARAPSNGTAWAASDNRTGHGLSAPFVVVSSQESTYPDKAWIFLVAPLVEGALVCWVAIKQDELSSFDEVVMKMKEGLRLVVRFDYTFPKGDKSGILGTVFLAECG